MREEYFNQEPKSDFVYGQDKRGRKIKEICTEAGRDENGSLRSPDVLISNILTGDGRRFISLSDASRYLHKSNHYLSVMFSTAKKNAGGKLVQSIILGDNYVTRVDWVRRNEMVPESTNDGKIQGDNFTMW